MNIIIECGRNINLFCVDGISPNETKVRFSPFEFRIRIGEYIYDPKFNLIFNSISKYYLIMAIKDPQDILL